MKRILKGLGIALGVLVVLAILAVGFLSMRMSSRLEQRFDIQPVLSSVTSDSAAIARGRHVMEIEACQHCHGEDLAGRVVVDDKPFRIVAPNLTPGDGGVGASYTVSDWDRAIRSGVASDGRALFIMPVDVYHNLSDSDAAALIAFLQTLEPVASDLPKTEIRLTARLIMTLSDYDPAAVVYQPGMAPKMTPTHEPTAELGAYHASIACIGCHGEQLTGKASEDPACPPGPSLAAAAAWDLDAFVTTIRTGVNPGGRELDQECMPWGSFKEMTDIELEAVHRYLGDRL